MQNQFTHRWLELGELQLCQNLECIEITSQNMNFEFTNIVIDKSQYSIESFLTSESITLFENKRYIVISHK